MGTEYRGGTGVYHGEPIPGVCSNCGRPYIQWPGDDCGFKIFHEPYSQSHPELAIPKTYCINHPSERAVTAVGETPALCCYCYLDSRSSTTKTYLNQPKPPVSIEEELPLDNHDEIDDVATQPMSNCSNCGTPVSIESKFCSTCGAAQNTTVEMPKKSIENEVKPEDDVPIITTPLNNSKPQAKCIHGWYGDYKPCPECGWFRGRYPPARTSVSTPPQPEIQIRKHWWSRR